jgi:signal recognition particle subunit SRP54
MVLAELGGKLRSTLQRLQSPSSDPLTTESLNALLKEITTALIESDVNVKLVLTLRSNIQKRVGDAVAAAAENNNSSSNAAAASINRMVQKAVVEELTLMLTPSGENGAVNKPYNMKRGKSNVILFVGLQGAGKTTSIAKYAHYYQRRGWKTCMVCADTFRAGAFDQLKQNATKLRVPFYGSYTEADPVVIAEEGVDRFISDGFEVIIVDTSGRHRQEEALFDEMQEISAAVQPDNTIFVMDATQGQAVYDQALAFHAAVNVGSVIVTKLDGHAKGGGALSAVAATGSPIVFLGSGERFDDFDPFNAKSFVSKLLGFGDIRGLMDEMKSITDGKSQEEMRERMAKGKFTLRDMYNQFQSVMKLGPMDKVMGMIPGMPDYLIPKNGDDKSTNRLRIFIYIMDSMSDAELDGKIDMHKKNDPSVEKRIQRIAAGSGTHPTEVKMLLLAHKQFEGMVSKLGKAGMIGKAGQAKQRQMMEQMRKNPNAVMRQLQGNPQAMQMMQSMMGGAGGGMPDMNTLMQMMGGAGGGGMPDMNAMASMMGSMGGSMPGGMGGMPDMNAMAQMLGGGGGGMPDMNEMMRVSVPSCFFLLCSM